jgi:hypothetical protein
MIWGAGTRVDHSQAHNTDDLVVPNQRHVAPAAHGVAPDGEVGVDGGDLEHAAPQRADQARAHLLLGAAPSEHRRCPHQPACQNYLESQEVARNPFRTRNDIAFTVSKSTPTNFSNSPPVPLSQD